jgi:hypothetical protein
MNARIQKYPVVMLVVVFFSLLFILTASFGGTMIFRTAGQQEDQQNAINSTNPISNQTNGIANQSGPVVESIENQTVANQTGTATLLANLTQSDFETLSQDLTEASQALENNDTNTVLDELNSASGELFQVTSRQFDPAHVEGMTQEFNPLQTHIDQAQEAALKDDHSRMLEELSAADSELLKITQILPSSQE